MDSMKGPLCSSDQTKLEVSSGKSDCHQVQIETRARAGSVINSTRPLNAFGFRFDSEDAWACVLRGWVATTGAFGRVDICLSIVVMEPSRALLRLGPVLVRKRMDAFAWVTIVLVLPLTSTDTVTVEGRQCSDWTV